MSQSLRTIFALSTVPGRSGVAVIRITGPEAGPVLDTMAPPRPVPRQAALRSIRHPETGAEIDRALVLFFAMPRSETGEDVAEFQLHGSRAVIRAVLEALGTMPGCRLAEPGEFARRAFENGKLDLTGVEGLADLIDAETDAQRRQALRQASGGLARLYEGWRSALIEAAALVEAGIDFSDEADVSSRAFEMARERIRVLEAAVRRHLDDGSRGEVLRGGLRVVLAGPPNAGKSSLLNALAKRDVAIVSEEAGTTRDVIEVHLDLDGLPVIVSDTAGLREAEGKVEAEGIRRTLSRAREADLILWLIDPAAPAREPPPELSSAKILAVASKADLGGPLSPAEIAVSARTGEGIALLTARLGAIAAERIGGSDEPLITQARHRELVGACSGALADFLSGDPAAIEIRAEDLRRAAHSLGRITGRVDVEDVLDQVFARFCIGK